MRVAIEALGIDIYGGGRTATLNLFEALFRQDSKNEYLIFLTQPEPTLNTPAGNVRQRIVPIRNRFLARLWAQAFLPGLVRGFDLVHFSKNLGVFGLSTPTVVTVYDMTTLIHPELYPRADVWYWQTLQKRTLQAAAGVIAISNTTARDLLAFYNLPAGRVRVIYPAISQAFKPVTGQAVEDVRKRYGLTERYFLHVGRIGRKKNLATLVQAYAAFRDQTAFAGQLVLVGREYRKSTDETLGPTIERLGLEKEVVFTGQVPDEDLPPLYSGALATVFPTLHEGFGLAPVEAMACGSPLIAHSAGALREAAGEAAFILETVGVERLAGALCQVAGDPSLREALRKKGLERAAAFQPEKSARQTLQLYEGLARG